MAVVIERYSSSEPDEREKNVDINTAVEEVVSKLEPPVIGALLEDPALSAVLPILKQLIQAVPVLLQAKIELDRNS